MTNFQHPPCIYIYANHHVMSQDPGTLRLCAILDNALWIRPQ